MYSYFLLMFVAEMSVSNKKTDLYSEGRTTLKCSSLDSSLKDSKMSAEVPLSKTAALQILNPDLWPLSFDWEGMQKSSLQVVTVSAHICNVYLWIHDSVIVLRLSLAPKGLNKTNLHLLPKLQNDWLHEAVKQCLTFRLIIKNMNGAGTDPCALFKIHQTLIIKFHVKINQNIIKTLILGGFPRCCLSVTQHHLWIEVITQSGKSGARIHSGCYLKIVFNLSS